MLDDALWDRGMVNDLCVYARQYAVCIWSAREKTSDGDGNGACDGLDSLSTNSIWKMGIGTMLVNGDLQWFVAFLPLFKQHCFRVVILEGQESHIHFVEYP